MAFPPSLPPSRPPLAVSAQDLSDAEFAELDDLLAGVPAPLEPLDVVMLDGFLAAVVVQPELIQVDTWMPFVFDANGHRWGEAQPGPEQQRARELIVRRLVSINHTLAEFGGFDPLILEPEDSESDPAAADPEQPAPPVLDRTTAAVAPWVAGFQWAAGIFPELEALTDDAVGTALARLYRFLPAENEEEQRLVDIVVRERPIASLDEAIEEIIGSVADLYDLTEPLRYQVDTVRRDQPKVGRNDACPCGSGKKFKHCHGSAGA